MNKLIKADLIAGLLQVVEDYKDGECEQGDVLEAIENTIDKF